MQSKLEQLNSEVEILLQKWNPSFLIELKSVSNVTLRKSMPSLEKSRGILASIDSRTSGSGMDRPAKNSLFLKTFICRGIRSPRKISRHISLCSSVCWWTSSSIKKLISCSAAGSSYWGLFFFFFFYKYLRIYLRFFEWGIVDRRPICPAIMLLLGPVRQKRNLSFNFWWLHQQTFKIRLNFTNWIFFYLNK